MRLKKLCVVLWVCAVGAHANGQMTVLQAVQLREPRSLVASPDGHYFAYVTKQRVVAKNEIQFTLSVAPVAGGPPRALVSVTDLGGPIRWTADGRSLIYLAKRNDAYQAWAVGLTGRVRQLTHHASGIGAGVEEADMEYNSMFRIAPDGRRAAFYTCDRITAQKQLDELWDRDLLYTDSHSVIDLQDHPGAWMKMPAAAPAMWVVDLQTGSEHRVWQAPDAPRDVTLRPIWFDWSPDGKYLALNWHRSLDPTRQRSPLILLSAETFEPLHVLDSLGYTNAQSWGADSASLTLHSMGESPEQQVIRSLDWYRYSIAGRTLSRIHEKDRAGVNTLSTRIQTATRKRVHSCIADQAQTHAACVREDDVTPPDVVAYSLTATGVSGPQKMIAHLNRELDGVRFGRVEPIRGRPEDGVDSALILPVDYTAGKRYPLVVMQYNVYNLGARFTGRVPMTSYAPQVFAGRGYAVILQNLPNNVHAYPKGDFDAARAHEADGVSGSLRAMLDQLMARDIVDPDRMGIMGWSFGGFLTPYIQTQHPQWFRAAAMGEAGNRIPSAYWLGSRTWREMEDGFFGAGGPEGAHAANWRAAAPIFNLDRMQAPLLIEYSRGYFMAGIEVHRAIQDRRKQSELHIYPREAHVLERPVNVHTSMQRHVDWFDFWLLGRMDPAPEKKEQYARWQSMRLNGDARQWDGQ